MYILSNEFTYRYHSGQETFERSKRIESRQVKSVYGNATGGLRWKAIDSCNSEQYFWVAFHCWWPFRYGSLFGRVLFDIDVAVCRRSIPWKDSTAVQFVNCSLIFQCRISIQTAHHHTTDGIHADHTHIHQIVLILYLDSRTDVSKSTKRFAYRSLDFIRNSGSQRGAVRGFVLFILFFSPNNFARAHFILPHWSRRRYRWNWLDTWRAATFGHEVNLRASSYSLLCRSINWTCSSCGSCNATSLKDESDSVCSSPPPLEEPNLPVDFSLFSPHYNPSIVEAGTSSSSSDPSAVISHTPSLHSTAQSLSLNSPSPQSHGSDSSSHEPHFDDLLLQQPSPIRAHPPPIANSPVHEMKRVGSKKWIDMILVFIAVLLTPLILRRVLLWLAPAYLYFQ